MAVRCAQWNRLPASAPTCSVEEFACVIMMVFTFMAFDRRIHRRPLAAAKVLRAA
jgi:hypothetical protein